MSLQRLGRYDLIRVLATGSMGVVYEGRDPDLEWRAAIKTVKVEDLSAKAAAELEKHLSAGCRYTPEDR